MSAAEGFEEFVAVVEAGSLTAAAGALGLPRPTLSRRLARLEERLGVRLLHRTTRRLTLSQAGERLYETARQVVRMAKESEADVQNLDGVPRGLLRVSLPPGLHRPMATWVAEYMRRYPEVQVELVGSTERVDLVADGFDLALRVTAPEDASLVARTLARVRVLAVATPRYLDARGRPQSLGDLAQHDCIAGFREGRVPEQRWPTLDGGWVPISGPLRSNEMPFRLDAALQHLGITLVVADTAKEAIERGELEVVLPDVLGRVNRVALVYPERRFLDPKVRAFIDHVAARIGASRAQRGLD